MSTTVQHTVTPLSLAVGMRIKYLRITRGLSQHKLGLAAGYPGRATIAAIETGTALPSLSKARDIARALGVTVGQLLGEEPSAALPPTLDMQTATAAGKAVRAQDPESKALQLARAQTYAARASARAAKERAARARARARAVRAQAATEMAAAKVIQTKAAMATVLLLKALAALAAS